MRKKLNKSPRLDAALPANPPPIPTAVPAWVRYFIWTLAGAAGVLALWAMFASAESAVETNRLALQWPGGLAAVIVRNKVVALWHAAGMTAAAAGFMALSVWGRAGAGRRLRAAAWVLVLLVAADALWLSRHYIKTMPLSALAENDVVRLLRADQPDRRVALAAQDGFYNFWLTYLFPHHNIRAVNVAQMPRMPNDYKNFLEAVGRNPVRFWQLMAVGYVLGPAPFWVEIRNNPAMREAFDLVYAYNVAPGSEGMGVAVAPATQEQPGQHAVLRLQAPAPRYTLITGWRAVPDAEALALLAADSHPLFQEALVAPEHAAGLPAPAGAGMTGLVQRVAYRPGYMRLSVSAPAACILRVSEKYDPAWRAWVDDAPAPVRRVDYLFQGVLVGPGLHEVVLRYAPNWWSLALQILTFLVCLVAAWRFLAPPRPVPAGAEKN